MGRSTLPYQFEVVHASSGTMGMAYFLSRHQSASNVNEQKFKAKELCNCWFTVNETIRKYKCFSANRKSQPKQNQPIGANVASENKRQDCRVMSSEASEVVIINKEPLKQIAAINKKSH